MEATVEYLGARELDGRAGDGVEVRLLWLPAGNRVFLHLIDGRSGDVFLVGVDPADARNAFWHPFAYLAACAPDRVHLLVEATRGEEVTT